MAGGNSLYERIYNLVRQIPKGKVATYGQIAMLVGTGPRQVGYAMAALPHDDVPWHRVINSKGMVSPRTGGDGEIIQRVLLEAEGVTFSLSGKVNLREFLWEPDLTSLV